MGNLSEELSLIIVSSIFLLFIASGIVILILAYQKKQHQYFREREQLKTVFEKEILESKLEIQEQTLKHISQEIHDNIGQLLSIIKINLSTVNIIEAGESKEKIHDSRNLITRAIQDLRHLSHSLNTSYVDEMGFSGALLYELEMIRKSGSCDTEFSKEGILFKLDSQIELILFRIVQEALNNSVKHANPKKIIIFVHYRYNQVILTISDDGSGFDPLPADGSENGKFGLGIKNMYNRARLINAEFTIRSAPGMGTVIAIISPKALPKSENNE